MRVAVFVDAGYVFAQGSCVHTGLKTPKPRDRIDLKEEVIVRLLKALAHSTSNGKELLRIYWYDGAPQSGPSVEQVRLAFLGDIKLRLGFLNAEGQQKGVDSLIVTDLVELSRNKAISDAVVVTGDDDIRVGIMIAQSHGVRVHVLGLAGAQSSLLLQEADTMSLWNKSEISGFLAIQGSEAKPARKPAVAKSTSPAPVSPAKPAAVILAHDLQKVVRTVLKRLEGEPDKLARASKVVKDGKDMPGYLVSVLKTDLQEAYGRKPNKAEQKAARDALAGKLKELA